VSLPKSISKFLTFSPAPKVRAPRLRYSDVADRANRLGFGLVKSYAQGRSFYVLYEIANPTFECELANLGQVNLVLNNQLRKTS
jgi:hypothetical protein